MKKLVEEDNREMDGLFITCTTCNGKGVVKLELPPKAISGYGDNTCPNCGGTGRFLSPAGKQIADVVRHLEKGGK